MTFNLAFFLLPKNTASPFVAPPTYLCGRINQFITNKKDHVKARLHYTIPFADEKDQSQTIQYVRRVARFCGEGNRISPNAG